MTRLFPKLTLIALAAATLAGQAQAHTIVRVPAKGGVPYTEPHERHSGITTIWSVKKHVRHAHRQSASTGNRTAQAARN
jgi:hypothetical protein